MTSLDSPLPPCPPELVGWALVGWLHLEPPVEKWEGCCVRGNLQQCFPPLAGGLHGSGYHGKLPQKTCTLACASWSCPLLGQSSLLPQLPYYRNGIRPVCQINIYPIAPLRRELEVAPLQLSAIPLPGPPTSTETTKDPNEPHTPMNLRHHSPGVLLLAVHWASR